MSESATVILGGGIIGVSTAYYLSRSVPGSPIHIVESSPEMFASASGKAGGFLAADWFGPSSAPLGLLSFKLHKELADEFNGKDRWGYSFSTGASFAESTGPSISGGKKARGDDWLRDGSSRAEVAGVLEFEEGDGPAWLTRRSGDSLDIIGADNTVAQVDPLKLSQFLLEECKARGVQLHQPAEAISVIKDDQNQLSGLQIKTPNGSETKIPCTRLLLASGAWTPQVHATLFPDSKLKIPISPLAGHSIVVKSPRWTSVHEPKGCHAVFTTSNSGFSPELISRIGGEIYVAGLNSTSIPLPRVATDAKIDYAAVDELKDTARRLCGLDGEEEEMDLEVTRQGLCFRPVTPKGQPIIARIGDEVLGLRSSGGGGEGGGVFVAAGHGPWGISLSLGTGLVMSEMMMGKRTSCRVSGLGMQ